MKITNIFSRSARLPRALRNHNPLNIRRTGDHWQGMTKRQTDKAFVQFENFYYGYRAACVILSKYVSRGWDTIAKIVDHWAPATENNTEQYTRFVEQMSGVPRTRRLRALHRDRNRWTRIIQAMTVMESGRQPNDEMQQALQQVLDQNPKL